MMEPYVTAYWQNGELVAHRLITETAIEVVVIAPDHPDFEAVALLAGAVTQSQSTQKA
jgi:hypothetical protein